MKRSKLVMSRVALAAAVTVPIGFGIAGPALAGYGNCPDVVVALSSAGTGWYGTWAYDHKRAGIPSNGENPHYWYGFYLGDHNPQWDYHKRICGPNGS